MIVEVRSAAAAIKPVTLQEYLRSRGWRLERDLSAAQGIALYGRDGQTIDVPQKPELADYPRRVAEVLGLVAEMEGRSPLALADELLQPVGDTIGVRVDSEHARSGTLPLVDSLKLREAAKNLILASAHSTISPEAYFPRLSRGPAVSLLSSVREGQNERGSFVARFIIPIDPAVGEQVDLDETPFGRRVVRLLMGALAGVHRVRSLGDYDELLGMEKHGVSGNLLAALSAMRGVIGGGSLELSVSWARNRPPPPSTVSRVQFPAETLDGLDAVVDRMRGRGQTKAFSVQGFVTRLDRPAFDVDAPGDVVLVPSGEDAAELARVHVHLDAHAYADAISAHQTGDPVRVVGTLKKDGRRWVLTDASGFERLPGDGDEPDVQL
ncbi:MAG: hypothetical protein SangKO_051790 [Sandaracinaceae bacterium]|nr:hypothetical protein [Myxococcales bacterium]